MMNRLFLKSKSWKTCTIKTVKEYGFYNEFLDATKEEEHGLQKVIEAYDERIGQSK